MNHRGMLVLVALTGLVATSLNAAEAYRRPPNEITSWLAQESNPATQTQSTESGTTDVYKIGGDVSAPMLIRSVEPRFPEAARRERLKAKVLVNMYIDRDGKPINVRSIRVTYLVNKGHSTASSPDPRVTTDLEASAVEAVGRYKFKPAMKSGKPVRVELNVEVPFEIF
jgi:outer membrane biosynthesis protein TonB